MRALVTLGEPLAWGLAAMLGAFAVAALGTSTLGVAVVGLLAIGLWLVWRPQPRRLLISGMYFLAPVDISKAIVAPLDQFYSPGLYVTPAHVLLLLLAALWVGRRVLVERRGLPLSRVDAVALVFFGWLCIRSVGTLQGTLAEASAVAYGLAVLAFYVSSHAIETADDLRLALRSVVVGAALELLWVGAQFATHSALALPGAKITPLSETLTFGGEGSAFRPIGFLSHPNSLADHMCLIVPPAFALVLLGWRRLDARVWTWALVTLAVTAGMLLATLSRGGWAAGLLGGAWVVYRFVRQGYLTRRHLAQMAIAGGLGLVGVVAAYPQLLLRLTGSDDRSTESRIILTDQALTIIKANPWVGVGFGGYNRAAYEYIAPAFANVSHEYQEALLQLVVHNHYLLVASQLGVPAAVYFFGLMICFILLPRPWNAWRDPSAFALAVGLSGAMVAQLLFLSSDNFNADIRIFMIWLTAGTLQALCLQRRAAEALEARQGAPGAAASPSRSGA